MNRINELIKLCNGAERFKIASMLTDAANYVRAVTVMEVAASNVEGLDADDFRDNRESTDRSRTIAHNALISSVNAVNEICDKYGFPRIYTGSEQRREYGDFAMELVAEIFANRN